MNRLKISTLGAALTLGLLATPVELVASPGAHGPNGEHLDGPTSTGGVGGLGRLPDGSVNVPMSAQRRMGVRTMFSKAEEASASLELLGRVTNDPNAGGVVQAMSSGRLEAAPGGLPTLGQQVRKGQVLAYVRYNADPYARSNQQAQLAQLRNNLTVAQQRVARLESLADTVPRKEIEAAKAELAALRASTASVSAGLEGREALVAPVSGVIAQADAISGQVVDARDVLFQIVDPSRLQVHATTADPGLAAQIEGASLLGSDAASLKLVGGGGSLRDGLIPLNFSLQLDPDNAASLPLAVGQPVTVVVRLASKTRGVILPKEAVVRNAANETIVWIKGGAERYIPQPVQAQPIDGSRVVVTQGLGDDNRVVTQGAALIAQIR
jgi:cobalt-zinc-cadmium efflux system membrane fusion protein